MIANRVGAVLVFAGVVSTAAIGSAQDFRVESTVYDLNQAKPLERTVTLFHAGRTYDYINSLGELIVFDNARSEFILVNTRQKRAAVVHVDQIKRMVQLGRDSINNYIKKLQADNRPAAEPIIEQLEFQFHPQFDETLTQEQAGQKLDLQSKYFRYSVVCASPPTPSYAQVYLNYTDWICRLNYVLNPGGILPDQRIEVNQSLRKMNAVPVEVTFLGGVGNRIATRALHHMYWELNDKDRDMIREWDALLSSRSLKRLSFQDYQRALLVSQASRSR
jgi:hypothetical protein